MMIRIYRNEDKSCWDEYVSKNPQGTVFHLTSWKEAIEYSFGHKSVYFIAESNEKTIVGILPLFIIKSYLFGYYIVSIPFAEIGGILANDHQTARQLFLKAIELSKEIGCDYLELRNRYPISDLPTKLLYHNFKREILSDPEANLSLIPRKARRMIRQGVKNGLFAEIGNHGFHDFYEILALNYHRLGTPIFPRRFFRNFLKVFKENCIILVVRTKEKIPIAAVLSFFFNDQIVPYYAGSNFDYRMLAPNDFMYWELMRYGCEKGYRVFDFGRSKKGTGSFDFKRHWGFEPVQLAYQYFLCRLNEMPNLSPANPKYKKKIEMWRKLPLPVTKIIGPPIARFLA